MKVHHIAPAAAATISLLAGCSSPPKQEPTGIFISPQQQVSFSLDRLHKAAEANEERYFDLYAKDAVFLGTDAKERWTLEEFKAFAHPYFAKGKAWTYTPVPGTRHVTIEGKSQDVACFDEQLDNAKLGRCRGSGVLIWEGDDHGAWKIKQYNLTMLVPNEIAEQVATMSKESPGIPQK